mmetsp:Transcript_32772/g.64940  ORF Transcript_32772/g.64940 Transcript_32772/m.64940 type:complete len:231 (+) Transcript_32772:34-726(+)
MSLYPCSTSYQASVTHKFADGPVYDPISVRNSQSFQKKYAQARANKHFINGMTQETSQNINGRRRQTIPYSKGVRVYTDPKNNRGLSKIEFSVEAILRDANSKGGKKKFTERIRYSKSVRAEMIVNYKLKKRFNFVEAPEDNDSVKAFLRDNDFNEGKRAEKVVRAECVARYKLKKLFDEAPPEEIFNLSGTEIRNKTTKMFFLKLRRKLSSEYILNKERNLLLCNSELT